MTMKTAISLNEGLFNEIASLAIEMNIPRSRLFVMAVEEFIQRRRNQQLLESINAAYTDSPDEDEEHWLVWGKKQMAETADEWK